MVDLSPIPFSARAGAGGIDTSVDISPIHQRINEFSSQALDLARNEVANKLRNKGLVDAANNPGELVKANANPILGDTIFDKAYNEGARAVFLARTTEDFTKQLLDSKDRYLEDPEGFRRHVNKISAQHLAALSEADPSGQLAADAVPVFSELGTAHFNNLAMASFTRNVEKMRLGSLKSAEVMIDTFEKEIKSNPDPHVAKAHRDTMENYLQVISKAVPEAQVNQLRSEMDDRYSRQFVLGMVYDKLGLNLKEGQSPQEYAETVQYIEGIIEKLRGGEWFYDDQKAEGLANYIQGLLKDEKQMLGFTADSLKEEERRIFNQIKKNNKYDPKRLKLVEEYRVLFEGDDLLSAEHIRNDHSAMRVYGNLRQWALQNASYEDFKNLQANDVSLPAPKASVSIQNLYTSFHEDMVRDVGNALKEGDPNRVFYMAHPEAPTVNTIYQRANNIAMQELQDEEITAEQVPSRTLELWLGGVNEISLAQAQRTAGMFFNGDLTAPDFLDKKNREEMAQLYKQLKTPEEKLQFAAGVHDAIASRTPDMTYKAIEDIFGADAPEVMMASFLAEATADPVAVRRMFTAVQRGKGLTAKSIGGDTNSINTALNTVPTHLNNIEATREKLHAFIATPEGRKIAPQMLNDAFLGYLDAAVQSAGGAEEVNMAQLAQEALDSLVADVSKWPEPVKFSNGQNTYLPDSVGDDVISKANDYLSTYKFMDLPVKVRENAFGPHAYNRDVAAKSLRPTAVQGGIAFKVLNTLSDNNYLQNEDGSLVVINTRRQEVSEQIQESGIEDNLVDVSDTSMPQDFKLYERPDGRIMKVKNREESGIETSTKLHERLQNAATSKSQLTFEPDFYLKSLQ